MASMSGYRSPVDLKLARTPDIEDPELFEEFTQVFNSIHLINAYLDRLRIIAGGGGSGQTPAETLPFNRFFVATALQDLVAGDLVAPSGITGQNGVIKGALPHIVNNTSPLCHFAGFALNDALTGQDVRVGVGPASLEIPGATGGSYIWGYSSRATNGNPSGQGGLYLSNPGTTTAIGGGTVYAMPVGVGIGTDYALFGQFLQR